MTPYFKILLDWKTALIDWKTVLIDGYVSQVMALEPIYPY